MSGSEHARREIKTRRALRIWERRQVRNQRYAVWLAVTGRIQLARMWLASMD